MSGKLEWHDLGWEHVVQTVQEFGTAKLKAGIVGAKAEEPHGDGRLTNGEAATINEFGTADGHVPARSSIRHTLQNDQGAMMRFIAEAVRKAIAPRGNVDAALQDVGHWAVAQFRAAIARGVPPENALATVLRKQSDHTLIDTGQLMDAIGFEVTKGGAGIDDAYESFELSGDLGSE